MPKSALFFRPEAKSAILKVPQDYAEELVRVESLHAQCFDPYWLTYKISALNWPSSKFSETFKFRIFEIFRKRSFCRV